MLARVGCLRFLFGIWGLGFEGWKDERVGGWGRGEMGREMRGDEWRGGEEREMGDGRMGEGGGVVFLFFVGGCVYVLCFYVLFGLGIGCMYFTVGGVLVQVERVSEREEEEGGR